METLSTNPTAVNAIGGHITEAKGQVGSAKSNQAITNSEESKNTEFEFFLTPSIKKIRDPKAFEWFKARHREVTGLRTKFVKTLVNLCIEQGDEHFDHNRVYWNEQLPMIIEITMSILYYDNQILDRKRDITNHAAISRNVKEARIIQCELTNYILNRVPEPFQPKTLKMVMDIINVVTIGQDIQEQNTYAHWTNEEFKRTYQKITKEIIDYGVLNSVQQVIESEIIGREDRIFHKSKYIKTYLERVYLTNSYLFVEVAKYILAYSSIKEEDKNVIIRFGAIEGFLNQFINDISDFIPMKDVKKMEKSATKLPSDALRDMDNSLVTLPVIFHLAHSNKTNVEQFLRLNKKENQYLSFKEKEKVVQEIINDHSIYFAMSIAKSISKNFKSELLRLSINAESLIDILQVAENNRIYAYFYRNKEAYRAYQKAKGELKIEPQSIALKTVIAWGFDRFRQLYRKLAALVSVN